MSEEKPESEIKIVACAVTEPLNGNSAYTVTITLQNIGNAILDRAETLTARLVGKNIPSAKVQVQFTTVPSTDLATLTKNEAQLFSATLFLNRNSRLDALHIDDYPQGDGTPVRINGKVVRKTFLPGWRVQSG